MVLPAAWELEFSAVSLVGYQKPSRSSRSSAGAAEAPSLCRGPEKRGCTVCLRRLLGGLRLQQGGQVGD